MKLTPGQLREVLELSPDSFRHWKQALAPLADRNGHRPCFSVGDVLAVAFVKELVDQAAVRVSGLAPIAEELFRICNTTSWAILERATLLLELGERRVEVVPLSKGLQRQSDRTAIAVAGNHVVAAVRQRLMAGQETDLQRALDFPPTIIPTRKATERH